MHIVHTMPHVIMIRNDGTALSDVEKFGAMKTKDSDIPIGDNGFFFVFPIKGVGCVIKHLQPIPFSNFTNLLNGAGIPLNMDPRTQ